MVAVMAVSEACLTSIGSECPNQIMFNNYTLTYNQAEMKFTSINDDILLAQNPDDRTWMYKSGTIFLSHFPVFEESKSYLLRSFQKMLHKLTEWLVQSSKFLSLYSLRSGHMSSNQKRLNSFLTIFFLV